MTAFLKVLGSQSLERVLRTWERGHLAQHTPCQNGVSVEQALQIISLPSESHTTKNGIVVGASACFPRRKRLETFIAAMNSQVFDGKEKLLSLRRSLGDGEAGGPLGVTQDSIKRLGP